MPFLIQRTQEQIRAHRRRSWIVSGCMGVAALFIIGLGWLAS